jgi:hypothetical protein
VPERDATNGRRGGDGSRKLVLERCALLLSVRTSKTPLNTHERLMSASPWPGPHRFLQGAKRGDVRALQEIAEAEPGVIDARNIDK